MAISDYRFDNLPRSTQIVVFTVIVLCLAVAFYFYYLKDIVKERDNIQADIARLEVSVAQATAIEGRLKRFREELKQLEERLAVLQAILPAEKETPTVLRSVQQMASSSNLKIQKFTPQPVVPRVFYSDWPIQIDVEGNFDGLGAFFEKISHATRIINVDSISVTGFDKEQDMNPSHTLKASCTATTFVFREDQAPSDVKDVKEVKKGVKR
ncbi:MAG: type 4a pilus biogenesis protein PilO [Acidobacteriota bacterium]|jgi:Tfp pilus assembly protein PilO